MLVLGLVLAMSPAAAQTFGEINGTVTDPSGAVIAGAQVTVTNTATNVSRQVETNESGSFAVPFLNPGVYNLTAELTGFKTAQVLNRVVEVGDVQEVRFVMEIGAVTEVIEVQAGAQMLQTADSSLGTVIDQQRIVELPINGRNYLNLVKLSTNVSAEMPAGGQANSRQGGQRANQAISVGGQRQQYNRFTLDGVENTDPNFNTFVVRPSVDALQEFKVQTGVYSAQFGKAASQINVTTRAGGNDFHGTLFEFLRNDKIQARPWNLPRQSDGSESPKTPFRRNQFGFTVTGPVVKNKLFFMANYEGFRERVQGVGRATVADQAMRNGDFSNTGALTIYDPDTIRPQGDGTLTADPFPNQTIPTSRFKQPFVTMLEFLPMPTISGAVPGVAPFNFSRNSPNPLDWDQFTTRVDLAQSANSQWFGRYSWGSEFLGDGGTFPIQDERIETKVDQFMLSNIWTLSPTIVNELRLGANIFDNSKLTALNGIRDVTSELNIPGLVSPIEAAWGTPQVGQSGNAIIGGWGEATGGPFINHNRTYQILDNMSWVRGNHTVKFGAELGSVRFNQVGNQFPRGLLQFHSRATALPGRDVDTGDAFAAGLLGWMDEATRSLGIANVQFRQTYAHFYGEDTWKIRPNLTMNIGLRYEYTPPFQDRYRGVMNVQMFCPGVDETGIDESCQTPVLVRPGAGDFHEGLNVHMADNVPTATGDDVLFNHATVKKDTNDFGPRIGLSYQPDSKTTIRTGFGVYYSQDTGNPVFDMGRNFGFRQSARGLETRPTVNLDSPWATAGSGNTQCSNWDGPCVNGLYTFGNDARRRTPYIMQYLLNVQRQVTDTMMVEVGYSGNQGRKLQRMYGFNTPLERADPTDLSSVNDRRPWGGDIYGRIQTIANVSQSSYNALALKLRQRHHNGLTYLVGYTWSRAIDQGSGIRTNGGDNLFPASSYDLRPERGLSQFHTGQRFTGSVLYDLPLRFENHVLEALAGGWQLGTILTFSTGTPFNGGACGQPNSNGQNNRGDATGISPFPDNPTANEFFVKAAPNANGERRGGAAISCFVPVTINGAEYNALSARQGNIARNVYISPGYANMDFSMMKNFRMTERFNLQFRFESFNFTNHPNWNNPNTGTTSLNYGVITSARSMRTNQFALKFMF
ncbi:MAG: carboxypeptidase regulatory-like domain-containing protein [Acidobacteria bacterium]|nr:carboxypeptidase regulatory-like domain-containing protein [Acidobacteriota bacterium]